MREMTKTEKEKSCKLEIPPTYSMYIKEGYAYFAKKKAFPPIPTTVGNPRFYKK